MRLDEIVRDAKRPKTSQEKEAFVRALYGLSEEELWSLVDRVRGVGNKTQSCDDTTMLAIFKAILDRKMQIPEEFLEHHRYSL